MILGCLLFSVSATLKSVCTHIIAHKYYNVKYLIKFIFTKFSGMAHFMVMGFLLGSVGGIFLTLPKGGSNLAGIIMLFIGLAISLLFVYLGKKVDIDEKG